MLRKTRVRASVLALMLVLLVAACNLTRNAPSPTPLATQGTPLPTFPPGTFNPSVTPFNLTPPTIDPNDGTCPQPQGWVGYVVEPGDSLGALAEATGSTVAALEAANCMNSDDTLFVGETIWLPTNPIVG